MPEPTRESGVIPLYSRGEHFLLKLQRQYGNRYVQRVVDLARKADGEADVAPDVEAEIAQTRGNGQPLDRTVQRQMESAFGTDFSGCEFTPTRQPMC